MATIEEKRALRFRFMEKVYQLTDGSPMKEYQLGMVAPAIGLSEQDADLVAEYLVNEGLLEWTAGGGVMNITHAGVKEVEQALEEPGEPTEHFPAVMNLTVIGSMTQSQIQQGTVGSVQNVAVTVSAEESAAAALWVEEVGRLLESLELEADAHAEAEAQIATLEAQMKSSRPSRAVLKAAGAVLLGILTSATGSAAAELVKHAPQIFRP